MAPIHFFLFLPLKNDIFLVNMSKVLNEDFQNICFSLIKMFICVFIGEHREGDLRGFSGT